MLKADLKNAHQKEFEYLSKTKTASTAKNKNEKQYDLTVQQKSFQSSKP